MAGKYKIIYSKIGFAQFGCVLIIAIISSFITAYGQKASTKPLSFARTDSDSIFIFAHQLGRLKLNKRDNLKRETGLWVDSGDKFIRYSYYKKGVLNGKRYILFFTPFNGSFSVLEYKNGKNVNIADYDQYCKISEIRNIRRSHIKVKDPGIINSWVPKYIGYMIAYYCKDSKSFPHQIKVEGYELFDDEEESVNQGIEKFYEPDGKLSEVREYDAGKLIKTEKKE